MIQAKQAQINWTAIGIVVGSTFVVIGWFVVHRLTQSRERAKRIEQLSREVSDFEISIKRWVKAISDTHIPRNQVWGMTLRGAIDRYAAALSEIRIQSIENVEPFFRAIRPFLDADGKSRFDEAWQRYQGYNIEGRDTKDPETGEKFTSHIECKAGLIDCLEQLNKIAASIKL